MEFLTNTMSKLQLKLDAHYEVLSVCSISTSRIVHNLVFEILFETYN